MDAEARLANARKQLKLAFWFRNIGTPAEKTKNRGYVWNWLGCVRRLEMFLGYRNEVDYGTCPDCLR